MSTLVDSPVWIDYFRGGGESAVLDYLIDENLVTVNELILAELIPPLELRKEKRLVALLREVQRYPLAIEWSGIIELQVTCLKNGINDVGIPDLLIAQNAIQHDVPLLTTDRHFTLLSHHVPLSLYRYG